MIAAMKLNDVFLGRKAMTNLESILKSRDITLSTKICLVKPMVFPVVMYGCESWTIKKAEWGRIDAFELWYSRRLSRVPWTARRSNQWTLKDISLIIIGRTDAEAEIPILWPPDTQNWLIGKDLDAGKDWRQEEKEMTENKMIGWHYWLNGHESLACCSPWGHKEADMTELLNWTDESNIPGFYAILFFHHWILPSSPNTSTKERHFRLGPAPSFFKELLVIALSYSPVVYWAPSDLMASSFNVTSFVFLYCSWGSCGNKTGVVCCPLLLWTMFCQNSSLYPTVLAGFAQHGSQLTELRKPFCHSKVMIHEVLPTGKFCLLSTNKICILNIMSFTYLNTFSW